MEFDVAQMVSDGRGFAPSQFLLLTRPMPSSSATVTVYGLDSAGTKVTLAGPVSVLPDGASYTDGDPVQLVIPLSHDPITGVWFELADADELYEVISARLTLEMPVEVVENQS